MSKDMSINLRLYCIVSIFYLAPFIFYNSGRDWFELSSPPSSDRRYIDMSVPWCMSKLPSGDLFKIMKKDSTNALPKNATYTEQCFVRKQE